MSRRGRCKCGNVMTFPKGPQGFKARCGACGAVVRLAPRSPRTAARVLRLRLARRLGGLAAPAPPPANGDQPALVETEPLVPTKSSKGAWVVATLLVALLAGGAFALARLFFGGTGS